MSLPKYAYEPLPTLRLPLDYYRGTTLYFRVCEAPHPLRLTSHGYGPDLGTRLGELAAPPEVAVTSTPSIAASSGADALTTAAGDEPHPASAKLMAAASSRSCKRERSQQKRDYADNSRRPSRSVPRAANAAQPKLCPSASSPVHADPVVATRRARTTSKKPDPRVFDRLYERRKPAGPPASTEVDSAARLAEPWNRSTRVMHHDAEPVVRHVSSEASVSKSASGRLPRPHGSQPPETRRAPQRGSGDVAIHSAVPSQTISAGYVANTTSVAAHRPATVAPERPSSAPKGWDTKGVLRSAARHPSKESGASASPMGAELSPLRQGRVVPECALRVKMRHRLSVNTVVEDIVWGVSDASDGAAGTFSTLKIVDSTSGPAQSQQGAGLARATWMGSGSSNSELSSSELPLTCAGIAVTPPPVSDSDVVRGRSHSPVETDTSIPGDVVRSTVSGMPWRSALDSRLDRPPLLHESSMPQSVGTPKWHGDGSNRSPASRYIDRDAASSTSPLDAEIPIGDNGAGSHERDSPLMQAKHQRTSTDSRMGGEPRLEIGWLCTRGNNSGAPVDVVAVGAVSGSSPLHGRSPTVGSSRDSRFGIASLSAPVSASAAPAALSRAEAGDMSHAQTENMSTSQDIPVYLVIPRSRPRSLASSLPAEGPAPVELLQPSRRSASTSASPASGRGSGIVAYKAIRRNVTMGLLRHAFDKWGYFVVARASAASRGAPNPHGLRSPADPQQVTQCLRLAQRSTEAVRLERLRIDAERLLLSGAFVHWRVIAQSHPSRRHVAEETTRSASSVLPSAASVKSTGGSSWQSRRHRLASAGSRASQPSTDGGGAVDGQGTPSPLRSRGLAWLDPDAETPDTLPDTPERHAEWVDVDERRTQPPLSPQSQRLGTSRAPGRWVLGDYHAAVDSPSPLSCDWSSPQNGSSYASTLPDRESNAVRTAVDGEETREEPTALGWWRSP